MRMGAPAETRVYEEVTQQNKLLQVGCVRRCKRRCVGCVHMRGRTGVFCGVESSLQLHVGLLLGQWSLGEWHQVAVWPGDRGVREKWG